MTRSVLQKTRKPALRRWVRPKPKSANVSASAKWKRPDKKLSDRNAKVPTLWQKVMRS